MEALQGMIANNPALQMMFQKVMQEQTNPDRVNLYDCFNMHYIEKKIEVYKLIQQRSKAFSNEFIGFAKTGAVTVQQPHETPNAIINQPVLPNNKAPIEKDSQPKVQDQSDPNAPNSKNDAPIKPIEFNKPLTNRQKIIQEKTQTPSQQLHVIDISSKEFLQPVAVFLEKDNSSSQLMNTEGHSIEFLHQFLEERQFINGYSKLQFDILVNRRTCQWTLICFQQGKKSNAEDLKIILQAFRNLNRGEDPLTLEELVNGLNHQMIASKDTGLLQMAKQYGWDIRGFNSISQHSLWNNQNGIFDSRRRAVIKEQENKPETAPSFQLYELKNLFLNDQMLCRIEAIMKCHIESLSNIDTNDSNWRIILAFDNLGRICGFMSYYKFGLDFARCKVRVSQVYVFHDKRRLNISSTLLAGLFSISLIHSDPTPMPKLTFEQIVNREAGQMSQQTSALKLKVEGLGVESPSPLFSILYVRFLKKNLGESLFDEIFEELKGFIDEQSRLR